ncbi:MAG: EAL domain-containing protein [Clostridia bacterium]|nr:EAL domain-containing protein [Clostridia bacterium]
MSFLKLLHKKKRAVAPTAQRPLDRELRERMVEFLDRDFFSLVVQPVVDFKTNTVFKGEVLSRLEHPERGVIFPDVFLPVINALNLYSRFDRYVFQKSCVWLQRMLAKGERIECISCNFSRKTLSEPTLAQDLIRIAGNYGISADHMAVEITERERIDDDRQLIENLGALRKAGFRIVLDDYGTGVTSMNDLMKYPLDIVKMDRSLLLNAQSEEGKRAYRALVDSFISLGTDVVCEGIETAAQDAFARSVGCRYGQGFLYFKPIRYDQVFDVIRMSSLTEETT